MAIFNRTSRQAGFSWQPLRHMQSRAAVACAETVGHDWRCGSCAPRGRGFSMVGKDAEWVDIGAAESLKETTLQRHRAGTIEVAVSCVGGQFGVIHNVCNHAGGPLGDGTLDGDYVVCPWHQWKF